jgi:hypothetical protein
MSLVQLSNLRVKAKLEILEKANCKEVLDQYLLRALVALERLDNSKESDSEQAKASEQMVKILRLIYVCLTLDPSYLDELNSEERAIKLNHAQLLHDIAHEIYVEEFYNLGTYTTSGQNFGTSIRPDWNEFLESLQRMVLAFKYDNKVAKEGMQRVNVRK